MGIALFAAGLMLGGMGCGFSFAPTPAGAVVGRPGVYDYSPSVIQSGNEQQFWWCGKGENPNKPAQNTDVILYESINLTTHKAYGPIIVMGETPDSWDSVYTCNPRVIRGSFINPLGDGQMYTYAMYYVGTSSLNGVSNSIGVAFSNDGIQWNKYKSPIILSTSQDGYGVGQPVAYNRDQKSGVWMFYEDNTPATHQIKTVSTDGVHFTVQGVVTTNGLDPNNPHPGWGDMGYDPSTGYWYAAFNLPSRSTATTGGVIERGQYGIELYRISDASLLSGATPWEQLKTIDTNLTGNESNFIAGLLHDGYGNINIGPYPTIQIFPSISNPPSSWDASPESEGESDDISTWDIAAASWVPNQSLLVLNRYSNQATHEVTTGWIDPGGKFNLDAALGHLYEAPQNGADTAFYGCKNGSKDYFISMDKSCGGKHVLGVEGYGYANAVPGINLMPLYLCSTDHDHFASNDPLCEGGAPGTLLGYVLP